MGIYVLIKMKIIIKFWFFNYQDLFYQRNYEPDNFKYL